MLFKTQLFLNIRFVWLSQSMAVVTLVIGSIVLLGWMLNIALFKSILPGLVEMKVNSAVAFIAASLALLLCQQQSISPRRLQLVRMLAFATLFMGLLTLVQHLFGWDLAIDELFFKDSLTAADDFPGRMATSSALSFLVVGVALLLLPFPTWQRLCQSLALFVGMFSLIALLGYLYDNASLYTLYSRNPQPLHTAAAFLALSIGILATHPHQGFIRLFSDTGPGGIMARRLLPACILIPMLLGWLILHGEQGGFYDASLSLALFAVLTMIAFLIVAWWSAHYIYSADHDRQRAEQQNRQSQAQFKTLFDETADVILVVEHQSGTILKINPAVHKILNYQPAALIGSKLSVLASENLDLEKLRRETDLHGSVFISQEFARANGTPCAMDMTALLIPWEESSALLITLRDMTERKRMEEALFQARLARIEMEKERELLKLKEQFVTMVSHDFRTPLAVIMSSNDILERYHERLTVQRRFEQLQRIREQVVYMTELLDDVLLLGTARADRIEFNPLPLNMESVCLSVFEQVQTLATERHHFIFQSAGNLANATLDEKLLRRMLSNLLSNAIKYSPDGGEIRLELSRKNGTVIICVSDQGIGIPQKAQARLFEPFQRAANASKISGTGLGLAIVYETVRVHGGDIRVESEEGAGTSFIITLPYH